jgi:hypothetical protein
VANAKVIAKARSERDYKIGIAVVALVLMVIMWATWSAHAEPLQSRSFYNSRGSFAGSAVLPTSDAGVAAVAVLRRGGAMEHLSGPSLPDSRWLADARG